MDTLEEMIRPLQLIANVMGHPICLPPLSLAGIELDEELQESLRKNKVKFLKTLNQLMQILYPGYQELVSEIIEELNLDVEALSLEEFCAFSEYCGCLYMIDYLAEKYEFTAEELNNHKKVILSPGHTEEEEKRMDCLSAACILLGQASMCRQALGIVSRQ